MSSVNRTGSLHGSDDRDPPDGEHAAFDDVAASVNALLLGVRGRVPDERVDWEAFHKRLCARAELSLARLRYPLAHVSPSARASVLVIRRVPLPAGHAWWEPAARWARLTVTGSVAAGIALAVVVRLSPKELPEATVAPTVVATEQLEGRRAAFESLVTGRTTSTTVESAILPTAADLLIPLGKGIPAP